MWSVDLSKSFSQLIVSMLLDFGVNAAIILFNRYFPWVVQVGLSTLARKIKHTNKKFDV